MLARKSLLVLLALPAAFFGGCLLTGCASSDRTPEEERDIWLGRAEAAAAAGFRGRLIYVFGNGHLLGQSFNLLGAHGFLELEITPRSEPMPESGQQP